MARGDLEMIAVEGNRASLEARAVELVMGSPCLAAMPSPITPAEIMTLPGMSHPRPSPRSAPSSAPRLAVLHDEIILPGRGSE